MNALIKIPPPVHGLLMLVLCKGLDMAFPLPIEVSSPLLGAALALPGLALLLWASLHFFLRKTTPIPTGEPSALVSGGPYRFTRNPMYLGLLSVMASIAFFLGSPFYLLSPVGLFLVLDRLFIPYEEAKLERLFGAEFARFKDGTGRWL